MRHPLHPHSPLVGLGMSSLVLGVIALVLFFLPILGIPISVCGLLLGLAGFVGGLFVGGGSLRWSLGGLFFSGLALVINLALAYAPESYFADRPARELWRPPPDRPYVSPPAPSQWVGDKGR
jgi:hypothetical protein